MRYVYEVVRERTIDGATVEEIVTRTSSEAAALHHATIAPMGPGRIVVYRRQGKLNRTFVLMVRP
jgi:hypothetical protein